jgi:NAD(P)H-nitrite reductase large subunit
MAVARKKGVEALFADKKAIQEIVAQQNAKIGFVKDPDATPQKAREMMLAGGIRPEDNEFSRAIIAAREEE